MALNSSIFENPSFARISELYVEDERKCVEALIASSGLSDADRNATGALTLKIISALRDEKAKASSIDGLLQEYDLSNAEGVALMRLSEALIRTPDFETSRLIIRDKIGAGRWLKHTGIKRSGFLNAAGTGLAFSNAWIKSTGGVAATNLFAQLGDRALEASVTKAMALVGNHFVLGQSIADAQRNAAPYAEKGYTFSYDMLGEAALTADDARHFKDKYIEAASAIAAFDGRNGKSDNISIKLSALHPRYEFNQLEQCAPALIDTIIELSLIARDGGFSITIDAEEADRLEASLFIFDKLARCNELSGWDGLGIVVQAYQKRAPAVIDWLSTLARDTDHKFPVRLVKGAYWDNEIKRAQELGLSDYPVFTQKNHTDISYLACARRLLDADGVFFPRFATHNAHSAAAILHYAKDNREFEFQRLHGMGGELHDLLIREYGVNSRIYAPVGRHKELLPYLVRRLLENGANSSFVHQLMDPAISVEALAGDPISNAEKNNFALNPAIGAPRNHLHGERLSAIGTDWTIHDSAQSLAKVSALQSIDAATSIINGQDLHGTPTPYYAPQDRNRHVSDVIDANAEDVERAVAAAKQGIWGHTTKPAARAEILVKAADLLEEHQDEFIATCVNEAGKSIPDTITEIREAVDFLRYYAKQALKPDIISRHPLGVVACISPWNFPVAIFLGQISANLAAGNAVIAKPADQTPVTAYRAVKLLHAAGIPTQTLQLIIGSGRMIGEPLIRHRDVSGVSFTGSTQTAKRIYTNLVETGRGATPLIAETGGVNAMIVDSTALIEQAVGDVIDGAFQSAGQRCSACRVVCVQDDIADAFETMLRGAVAERRIGMPEFLETDIGPLIDAAASKKIAEYIDQKKRIWRTVVEGDIPQALNAGNFIAPIAFEIPNIEDANQEVFGPVLHYYRFKATELDSIITTINDLGFGLTMGLHTRIDNRVDHVAASAHVGNLYINRNQIGAVVGVHPFGGEGMSGTGPKAGGPNYLLRLTRPEAETAIQSTSNENEFIDETDALDVTPTLQSARAAHREWSRTYNSALLEKIASLIGPEALSAWNDTNMPGDITLPGPTGEKNTLRYGGRGVILCIGGPEHADLEHQIIKALATRNSVIAFASSQTDTKTVKAIAAAMTNAGLPENLLQFAGNRSIKQFIQAGIDAIASDYADNNAALHAISELDGAIIPLLMRNDPLERFCNERTLTVNTTAAGGNASLLAAV